MKTKHLVYLFPLLALSLFAQEAQDEKGVGAADDIVVIDEPEAPMPTAEPQSPSPAAEPEQSPPPAAEPESSQPAAVVEIPEAEVEGASIDAVEEIPSAPATLLDEGEVVLELPGEETSAEGEATMATEETISVDFPDEDVRTILRNVADLFELNLVIPDTLQGRTSLKLRNITWRQAFEVVLEPLGYTFIEDRNIIRIKSIDEITTEPVDTRVFVINYARASEIQGSVQSLVDAAAGGQIRVDARSNALVITERPSRMNKIQEIIESLDKSTAQVMIESKFLEVTKDDLENIGVNWTSLSGYSASAGPFEREWTRSRTKSDDGSLTDQSTSSSTINTTDGSINGNPNAIPRVVDETNNVGSSLERVSELASSASTGRLDSAVFSADQFEVILSALETNNDIELVSNPTVVTLDNKEAKIAIGEKFPIPSYSFNAETGERQLDGIDFEDIGITLDVTPQVNSAGFINLSIVPEVSSRLGVAIVENTEIPIIASRRAETNIMIKDGFTLAIGGLSENETSKETTKVPFLGDLPGVGRLFSSDANRTEQRNLIIFITAKTLNPDGSTYKDIIDPRMLDEMGIVPSELPGYELTPEEKARLDQLETIRARAASAEEAARLDARIQQYEARQPQSEDSE